MKCPKCGIDPLEVTGVIVEDFSGIFDDEGNLKTEITGEEITYIKCISCKATLPLSLIKNWN